MSVNAVKSSNHEIKNLDMSKENLYKCYITKVRGEPSELYFHKMFLISDYSKEGKPFSVGLNYNDVNDIKYYDSQIYLHRDGGFGIAMVEMSGLSVGSTLNYKCESIPNTIFKPDN